MTNPTTTPRRPTPTSPGPPLALLLLPLTLLLLLAGCGSNNKTTSNASNPPPTTTAATTPSTPATTTTPAPTTTSTSPTSTTPPPSKEEHIPTEAKIHLTSPAIKNETLPAQYTCDGQNTPPPLHWTGTPPGTKELSLDILKLNPVNGKLYFAWAITHIPPNTTSITNGKLPPPTITGNNSENKPTYNLCPPQKTTPEPYLAVIFALPHHIPAQPGYNPTTQRKQTIHTANYESFLYFHYTRK